MNIQNLQYPERVHVELTSRCNFRCLTCKHGYENYGQDLDDKLCDFLINELMPYLTEIEFEGCGESLLYPNFERVFNAANKQNCKMMLITNGTLLTDKLIQSFVKTNLELIISLDGINEEEFRKHRPVGDFVSIIRNIKKIHEIRTNGSSSNFGYGINMVLTKQNRNSVKQMLDIVFLHDMDFLCVSEVRPCEMPEKNWNDFRLDNLPNRDELIMYISECKNYAEDRNIYFSFNPYTEQAQINKKICAAPFKHIYLHAYGAISPCCVQTTIFGDMKTKDFHTIWNGSIANEFRNNMMSEQYHKLCLNCCLPWGLPY